jgi:flagellin-like protein
MRNAKAVWHKDDDAVSPVIGTILMVAITVVLAAVLWLMVSGMISTGNETKTTVNIASPNVQHIERPVGTVGWDVSLNINKITPSDVKILWTELKITVKSATGSVLQAQISPIADIAPPYPNVGTLGYYFVETGTGTAASQMNAGDAIKITGMTGAWEGAHVELSKGGQLIGSCELPTNFP